MGIHRTATIYPQVKNESLNKILHFLSMFTFKGTLRLVGRYLRLRISMLVNNNDAA